MAAIKLNPRQPRRGKPLDPRKARPTLRDCERIHAAANTPEPLTREIIRPQKGPQERFLASPADIAIYGGAAGGGKTWAALFEPLRHMANSEFECVIFRRTRPQIVQAGGLLVESEKLYPRLRAKLNRSTLVWTFPSGMKVRFDQLQHESTKLRYQGGQIALSIFDELTHFSESQFFYIISRMRSGSGVAPYIRGTCNPDPDSWVATFIAWWIDQDTGLAIPERSGVIRWFVRDGDTIVWGDSRDELRAQFEHWTEDEFKPITVTFIAATIYDNQELLKKDPGYLAKLRSLPKVEREQLLGGNWKIRAAAGLLFKEVWFGDLLTDGEIPDLAKLQLLRRWDFAGTEPSKKNKDPDWNVGLLLGRDPKTKIIYVLHMVRFRGTPHQVQQKLIDIAKDVDGKRVAIRIPEDPGQAGKFQVSQFTTALPGFDIRARRQEGSKQSRWRGASAQAEAGNIKVKKQASWNGDFFAELEQVPDSKHDDIADALGDGFEDLTLHATHRMGSA